MSVLEILPGRGWYTEILAPVLKTSGKLTIASFGENHPNDYLQKAHIRPVKKDRLNVFNEFSRNLLLKKPKLTS